MKSFPIDSTKHAYYGRLCVTCGHPMRVGDVAMVEDAVAREFIHRHLVWHKRHVEEAVRLAPAESTEVTAAVDAILARIDAEGSPILAALGDDDD